jgi:hypothetical protein
MHRPATPAAVNPFMVHPALADRGDVRANPCLAWYGNAATMVSPRLRQNHLGDIGVVLYRYALCQ